ncbi:DUF4232 domain-containing protein [Corynebacterium bovis]|uniref:DUF4232 domain-containing protein n=1 Tax=Corynebacterium bovis TaxID=36808 RepID=UPI000F64B5A1|nr:DUF4232 domain-containing protein [Corynebacterium bovis]RRO81619.1 hypothetical protein CXF36_06785 [Corynebacterium bovis]RRO81780.1 hypothetical protein CXF38_02915 [Corynebacterium bovis]RRO82466.1 hypothetical protein CXF37_06755 [Corynebacterium bovis]RRO90611.1 hypothetical protein CXF45_05745 [Corynebacterium bovis]
MSTPTGSTPPRPRPDRGVDLPRTRDVTGTHTGTHTATCSVTGTDGRPGVVPRARRTRTGVALGLVTAATAVTLAACSPGDTPAPESPSPGAGLTGASSATATGGASRSTSTSTAPSAGRDGAGGSAAHGAAHPSDDKGTRTAEALPPLKDQCRTRDLSVTATRPEGAAGSEEFSLMFTNNGRSSCSLRGYPGVSFVGNSNGTQLGAGASREAVSGSLPVVTLASGASATASGRAGTRPADECRPTPADGLRVYPPDETTAAYVDMPGLVACADSATELLSVQPVMPVH